eukprot:Colp12_sorted_trinity150504_noHs@22325
MSGVKEDRFLVFEPLISSRSDSPDHLGILVPDVLMRPCWHFSNTGQCPVGDNCKFPHRHIEPVASGKLCVLRKLPQHEYDTNSIFHKTLKANGFEFTDDFERADLIWTASWPFSAKHGGIAKFDSYVNQFPGIVELAHKDKLLLNLRKESLRINIPEGFLLPLEYEQWVACCKTLPNDTLWIQKPLDQGCGRGVSVIKYGQVDETTQCVVSRYIANCALVNNYKFDLRVYVLVFATKSGGHEVFVYREGLVRFAAIPYDLSITDLTQTEARLMHVTNNSKTGLHGKNWCFAQLRAYLTHNGYSWEDAWSGIKQLITTSLQSVSSKLFCSKSQERVNCFQLLGYDVLLDDKIQPWLLEVNSLPDLGANSKKNSTPRVVDYVIKSHLVADVLTMLRLPREHSDTPYEPRRLTYGTNFEHVPSADS